MFGKIIFRYLNLNDEDIEGDVFNGKVVLLYIEDREMFLNEFVKFFLRRIVFVSFVLVCLVLSKKFCFFILVKNLFEFRGFVYNGEFFCSDLMVKI